MSQPWQFRGFGEHLELRILGDKRLKALKKDWNLYIESNCDVNKFAVFIQSSCHSKWSIWGVDVKFEAYLTSNTKDIYTGKRCVSIALKVFKCKLLKNTKLLQNTQGTWRPLCGQVLPVFCPIVRWFANSAVQLKSVAVRSSSAREAWPSYCILVVGATWRAEISSLVTFSSYRLLAQAVSLG